MITMSFRGREQARGIGALVVFALVCSAFLLGCGPRPSARSGDQARNLEAVSRVEPKLEPMTASATPVPNAPPVASVGNCGPRYANGSRGSCINEQPCRGFGIRAENGQPICACYAKRGGCGDSERCDAIKKTCVPENEPSFGRGADD